MYGALTTRQKEVSTVDSISRWSDWLPEVGSTKLLYVYWYMHGCLLGMWLDPQTGFDAATDRLP